VLLEITQHLLLRENIGFEEIQSALDAILQGQCEAVAIAGFLTALITASMFSIRRRRTFDFCMNMPL